MDELNAICYIQVLMIFVLSHIYWQYNRKYIKMNVINVLFLGSQVNISKMDEVKHFKKIISSCKPKLPRYVFMRGYW